MNPKYVSVQEGRGSHFEEYFKYLPPHLQTSFMDFCGLDVNSESDARILEAVKEFMSTLKNYPDLMLNIGKTLKGFGMLMSGASQAMPQLLLHAEELTPAWEILCKTIEEARATPALKQKKQELEAMQERIKQESEHLEAQRRELEQAQSAFEEEKQSEIEEAAHDWEGMSRALELATNSRTEMIQRCQADMSNLRQLHAAEMRTLHEKHRSQLMKVVFIGVLFHAVLFFMSQPSSDGEG